MPALPPYIIEPIWEQFVVLLPQRDTQHPWGSHRPRIPDRVVFETLINRRGGGEPLRYYHHDSVGSVVGLTNNRATLTDTYSYVAFGGMSARSGAGGVGRS